MVLKIKNISEETIIIGGSIKLEPSVLTCIYDESDESTYNIGYDVLNKHCVVIEDLLRESKIEVIWDNAYLDEKSWRLNRDIYYVNIFNYSNISFESNSNMYYSLSENKLKIYNPIRKKWYYVSLLDV